MTRLTSRLLTLVVFIAAASSFAQKPLDTRLRVASPDGQIVFILSDAPHTHAVDPASSDLRYSIDFRTKWLMDESSLGLKVAGQPPLGPGMNQVHLETPPRDDAHAVSPGKTKTARGRYNSALVDLADDAGRKLTLEIRAYDDGVAFRYILPNQPSLQNPQIERELTQFVYNENATVYPSILNALPNALAIQGQPRAVGNVSPQWLLGLPLTGQVIGIGWVSIAESRIGSYPGIDLRKEKSALGFYTQFAPRSPEVSAEQTVLSPPEQTPFTGPWRVLIIAGNRSDVVASDLVTRLGASPAQP